MKNYFFEPRIVDLDLILSGTLLQYAENQVNHFTFFVVIDHEVLHAKLIEEPDHDLRILGNQFTAYVST
jgi:hypothetical protein